MTWTDQNKRTAQKPDLLSAVLLTKDDIAMQGSGIDDEYVIIPFNDNIVHLPATQRKLISAVTNFLYQHGLNTAGKTNPADVIVKTDTGDVSHLVLTICTEQQVEGTEAMTQSRDGLTARISKALTALSEASDRGNNSGVSSSPRR